MPDQEPELKLLYVLTCYLILFTGLVLSFQIAENCSLPEHVPTESQECNRVTTVYSLDRAAFPSLNGRPGETHHSYIADDHPENNGWEPLYDFALKDEVNKLLTTTLGERERYIIRLYYGLDGEFLTWEDISSRIGLSRERVRQIGLVAAEKLKQAAREKRLDIMLVTVD
ncbi:hypothetical protein Vadar_010362 [Vaccinium darrowii]|uniref:Uncharacterized protein n=1 Tax=Vaccinium darrowii TaxID=229202 RepID=A0ACB7YMS4_9ERIC|nr:hypothetical protein Vadar_010362 [Vaccinium darrowii]